MLTPLTRFLAVYDYGMGGLWGIVEAASAEDILAVYPELVIVDARPEWMDDERWAKLNADAQCLHDTARGILRAILAARDRAT